MSTKSEKITWKITWTDGSTSTFNDIPKDLDEAKVKAALEAKHKKKIYKYQDLTSPKPSSSGKEQPSTAPSSQDDRNSSSQPGTPNNAGAAPTLTTLPSGQRDDETDYRDKFPDKFTPKNMRRNKWGELIYE